MVAYVLNLIGLIADIVGVLILFQFGLLGELSGVILADANLSKGKTTQEIKKSRRYAFMPKLGLWLIIIGFSLQFISNYLSLLAMNSPTNAVPYTHQDGGAKEDK